MVRKPVDDKRLAVLLYILSLVFLFSMPFLIEYPVGDEFAYVKQVRLLLEGKTQPNWLLSTSYLTMLIGMPFIKFGLPLFTLRFLMILIGALSTPLMYLILREADASKTLAILGALVLFTNPFINLHLKQFITEPVSLPLYLLSILFFIKTLKTGDGKFLFAGVIFSILGFLNKQIDLIPAAALFMFLFIHLNGKSLLSKTFGLGKHLTNVHNKMWIASLPMIFLIVYFGFNYLTAGNVLNPTTVPSTVSPNTPYAPQFGIHPLQSPFRIIQDLVFLGFFFFPFTLYLKKYIKPTAELFGIKMKINQTAVIVLALVTAALSALSGKPFIFHSNQILVFVSAFIFAYSGINLGLLVIQNRRESAILNYAFIALIGCLIFTVLKINIFLLKYYVVFIPFIIIVLATKIRDVKPYILTILILGGFSVVMSINSIQFYDKLWNETNVLLAAGVEPSDFDGQPTVVSWLNDLTDNLYGSYKIIAPSHHLVNDLFDVDSLKIVRVDD